MNPHEQDGDLATAAAAARRLLLRAIDLHFDLDEVLEASNGTGPTLEELQTLCSGVDALQRDANTLREVLRPAANPTDEDDEVAATAVNSD